MALRPIVSDTSLAVGAVSTPWWIPLIQDTLGLALAAAGLVLVVLRIVLTYRELKHKRRES